MIALLFKISVWLVGFFLAQQWFKKLLRTLGISPFLFGHSQGGARAARSFREARVERNDETIIEICTRCGNVLGIKHVCEVTSR